MEKEFAGKVVLVTGGGSGIGAATALAFACEGATVAVADQAIAGAEAVAASIRDGGGKALAIRADVSQAVSVDAMVQRVVKAYGRLDVAVNNAGIAPPSLPTAEVPEADFDRVISINLKGVWLCMKAEIPALLAGGGGVIVNLASVLGLIGIANSSPYVAAKHGVVGLTKTAALEYSNKGIRINAVCPGVVETPMTQKGSTDPTRVNAAIALHPIGRVGQTNEIAEAILWLASPRSSFMTGAAMPVDGGWSAH